MTLSSGGGLNEIVGKGDQGQSPEKYVERVGVGDVSFFLTMRCFPILSDAMF